MDVKKIKLNQLYSVNMISNFNKMFLEIFHKASDLFRKVQNDKVDIVIYDKGIIILKFLGVDDKFTELDWIVQHIIEQYIDKYFPGLIFIGEEKTENKIEYGDKYKYFTDIVDLNLNIIAEDNFDRNEFEFNDVKVFIDPIDATMDYIRKNQGVVTVLVGIVYKEQPLTGMAHYPFYGGADKSVTYLNIPSKGIFEYFTYTNQIQKIEPQHSDIFLFSCSKTKVTPQMEKSIHK